MELLPTALFGAEQRARLDLRLNQKNAGEVEVIFRGDDIMIRVEDLKATGIDPQGGRIETIYGFRHVSLKSLTRDLSFDMNEADLSLRLTLKQAAGSPKTPSNTDAPRSLAQPVEVPVKREMVRRNELPARLALFLDGARKGELNVVVRGREVLARLKDVEAFSLNITAGQHENIRGESYVSLQSLSAQFDIALDERELNLRLTSKPTMTDSNMAAAQPTPAVQVPSEFRPSNEPAKISDQRAILTVRVNELKKGETDVVLRGDDVLARVKDLQAVGMAAVKGRQEAIFGEYFVSLRSLAPSLLFAVNDPELALDLTLTPDAFSEHVVSGRDYRPEKMQHREDTSAFVNYAVNATNFHAVDAFSELGVTIKNALLYSSVSRNTNGEIMRGFSNVTLNDRDSNIRTLIGDRSVNSDFLGGSITMGGLSYYRDFALDPYFVRNPGLNYSGAVSTPSTLDIFSNGRLVRRVALPPGQFELKDLPVPSGSNNTRFVLRDAFGRERELGSQFFYFTSGLLKPGLHDFSYNLGARRDDLADGNWGYNNPAFLAYHRYGFSQFMTGGLRLEGGRKLVSGGPSFPFMLPLGEMELASAASNERGRNGGATFLGYSYINGLFSLGSSIKIQSEHYATTSLSSKRERSWLESGTYVAFPLTDLTTVNLRYGFADSRQSGLEHRLQLFTGTRLSKTLTLLAGASYDSIGGSRSAGFNIGLSFYLGEVGGTLVYDHDNGSGKGTLDVRKNLPIGPGYGYGLQASTNGDIDSIFQYQTTFGRYEADYNRYLGQQGSRLSAAGGLAFIDGSMQFTRPVQDSFALIKVPELSGVRGYLNNLEVGTTDSKGRLFVPNLLSYYGNNLAISKKDLPFNYNADVTDKIVSAPYRGGVLVEFPVARVQRVVGYLLIGRGGKSIVPKHGQLTISAQGTSAESPLGNSGELYFENQSPGRYQAKVEFADDTCEFIFDMPKSADEMIALGTLRCEMP